MVAIVVGAVTISRTTTEPPSSAPAGTPAPGQIVAGPPIASYVSSGQVPPYYVATASHGNPNVNPSYAVVQATASGRTLATIQASVAHGTIVAVTAAADDRTFVLDEQRWGTSDTQNFEPRTFYEFRLNSSGQPGPLTRLPISVPHGELMTGLALSPTGRKLAMAVQPDNNKEKPNLTVVSVYTLATGAVRTWTGNGTIGSSGDDARSLSWADDERTLAFDWAAAGPGIHTGVWLLSLGDRGSNLIADSRQAVSLFNVGAQGAQAQVRAPATASPGATVIPVAGAASATATPPSSSALLSQATCQQDTVMTPDGSAIVCGTIAVVNQTETATGGLKRGAVTEFRAYSDATGKIKRILGRWSFASVGALSVEVLWSNASGSALIGVIPDAGSGRAGVISGNTFTPLPAQVASSTAASGTW